MRMEFVCGCVALAAVLAAPAAFAAQSTANMNVGITVTAACNVAVTDINFGSVPASTLASALTSTAAMGGLFTYTCGASSNTPTLAASQGQNYAGGNRMKGLLGGFLDYSLHGAECVVLLRASRRPRRSPPPFPRRARCRGSTPTPTRSC